MTKALIVDDELYLRKRLESKIDWAGIGVDCLYSENDGDKALELLKREKIQLLITDIRMPNMNGLDLAKEARKLYPDISIIIMSAYDDKEFLKTAIKLNVVDFIEKPFDLEEFTKIVAETLDSLSKDGEKVEEYENYVDKVFSYINKNLQDPLLNLKKISTDCCISVSYLSSIFKKQTGMSVKAYVNKQRMELAERMLRVTGMNISEIADYCGFTDQNYFTKKFVATFNMTPTKYRAMTK